MNITFRNITFSISIFFILWFISYFFLGEFFNIELSDREFSKIFPKILTFLCAVGIYILFLIFIKKSRGWSFLNILMFTIGILFSLIPIFLFEFLNLEKCANWKLNKTYSKTLYKSKVSSSETIKIVNIDCSEAKNKSKTVKRVIQITPFFISTSEVDTLKISKKSWEKL